MGWVKFTLLRLDEYDPNLVYFQNSTAYQFHHTFASEILDPFVGMDLNAFYQVALYEQGQQAILGAVLFPPTTGFPPKPTVSEYGIQFIRQNPFSKEEIAELFTLVQSRIVAESDVTAFYFPTFEQAEVAAINQNWFESQGIQISSTARWAEGNVCYSEGWALGTLKYVQGQDIDEAYRSGHLQPNDILLTDRVPAEIPPVLGVLSLTPSTPSSHVAILAQSSQTPFVYLAVDEDVNRAREWIDRKVNFSVYDTGSGAGDVRLMNVEGILTQDQVREILELKRPEPLDVQPISPVGYYLADTKDLAPQDITHFGGKASNFGILREAIPDHSPIAAALSFDLWREFLNQPLSPISTLSIRPGEHIILWADDDTGQGLRHLPFKLSRQGEELGLFAADGRTLIDSVRFSALETDVSFGRTIDGGGSWHLFASPPPGRPNASIQDVNGLVINELMADNRAILEDPDESGEYPDWIELYNGTEHTITLNGLYITDDMNEPCKWRIPLAIEGGTLAEEIANRLSPYTPDDSGNRQALSADLATIRSLIINEGITRFSPAQKNSVLSELMGFGFDPQEKLRFRSSTNVEDSENFSGAGLYDSFSGCLGDDLDQDDVGPSACDPNRVKEQGVFRAIRRVFASFYNDNAFEERLKHRIDETTVGMALLIHHSFPDEIELANGVATLETGGFGSDRLIKLVTQSGATSVTNPEGGGIPEEVSVRIYPSGCFESPSVIRPSNLVPITDTVMVWEDDYRELTDLILQISEEFEAVTGKTAYSLDLEYKKMAAGGTVLPSGGLIVKQVRTIPQPDTTPRITPFLIGKPTNYSVYSGEFEFLDKTDVFADHRLKSRLTLETQSMWLAPSNLQESLYADAHIEYLEGDCVQTLNGPLSQWPSAWFDQNDTTTYDTWTFQSSNPRTYQLKTTNLPSLIPASQSPLFVLQDLGRQPFMLEEQKYRCLTLHVEYDQPVRSWFQPNPRRDPEGAEPGLRTTRTNTVHLWVCPSPHLDDILQNRHAALEGIKIQTQFYWPPPPQGAGTWLNHTAPLVRWVQTVIKGYTQTPIILKGHYSQTYRPEHHNIVEHFLFEPRLEPGLSPEQLAELAGKDIRLIHLIIDNWTRTAQITTYGF